MEQVLEFHKRWRREPEWYQGLRQSLRQSVLKYDINTVFPQLENMFKKVAGQVRTVR